LSFSHHGDDARQERVRPDLFRADDEHSGAVDGGANDSLSFLLHDWNWFACDHRFVDRAHPADNDAIDRDFLAGPHSQLVSNMHGLQGHILLSSVVTNAPGGLRSQAEKLLDRCSGLSPRAKLQDLAEQD
jgi:hypothetical protein